MERNSKIFKARWVFPVSSPPIENGWVELDGNRITAVGNQPRPKAFDLGNVAIIPGLVNAHAHLEFSDLQQPLQPTEPFTDWINSVVAHRQLPGRNTGDIITGGINECHQSGTALVGEIATSEYDYSSDADACNLALVVFRELIGFRAEQIEQQLAIAKRHLSDNSQPDSLIQAGLSPHAPYSVHPELFQKLVGLAEESKVPLAMHLAETKPERQFLEKSTGPFVEMLKQFGVWEASALSGGKTFSDYLKPLADLERALVIHGNYLTQDEWSQLADRENITVVYCPRTHAYFQHDPHPWRGMLDAGVSVALGTDGRSSNPDLSLWRELQFLCSQFPDFDQIQLLELGTIRGAKALGFESELGTLCVGKQAQLVTVSLLNSDSSNPYDLLFATGNQINSVSQRVKRSP